MKIDKVMGMEMKSKAGKYVMADDPAFEPIYKDIAAHNRTLVAHLQSLVPAGSLPIPRALTTSTTGSTRVSADDGPGEEVPEQAG